MKDEIAKLRAEIAMLREAQRRDLADVDRFRAMARQNMDKFTEAMGLAEGIMGLAEGIEIYRCHLAFENAKLRKIVEAIDAYQDVIKNQAVKMPFDKFWEAIQEAREGFSS